MPIIFISLSKTFTEKIKQYGFEAKTMKIHKMCKGEKRCKTSFI